MKKKHLLEYLEKYPDDYEVCLSTYMQIPSDELEMDEALMEEEDFKIIVDLPIIGIAANDESQEIRFILANSDMECAEELEDEITHLDEDNDPPIYIPEVQ